jgi:hypothetical protein
VPETLLLAFDGKHTYCFGRAEKQSFSVFGGPMDYKISGKRPIPDRLHQIALLNHNDLPILGPPRYVFGLPLLYGMRYSGPDLTYKFEHSDVTILVSPGKVTEDWPYRDYPPLLPYVPLVVTKRKKQSWRQFVADFPNMKNEQPSDLIVVVPPPMTIGVSLWGREGDAEGVAIVFECDLDEKKVTAYNVCS